MGTTCSTPLSQPPTMRFTSLWMNSRPWMKVASSSLSLGFTHCVSRSSLRALAPSETCRRVTKKGSLRPGWLRPTCWTILPWVPCEKSAYMPPQQNMSVCGGWAGAALSGACGTTRLCVPSDTARLPSYLLQLPNAASDACCSQMLL